MGDLLTHERSNDLLALFVPLTGEKPPRRFRQNKHPENDQKTEKDLERNKKAPG